MIFAFGFAVGAAVVVCGMGAYFKHLYRNGSMLECDADCLIYVPNHFPIYMDEEDENKTYVDVDKIRLVIEDGQLVGWYQPAEPEV